MTVDSIMFAEFTFSYVSWFRRYFSLSSANYV